MHRLERLINLVAALLEAHRPLTIDELRFRLPGYAENDAAFRRAFERDKEALRELGVPLVTEAVDPLHPDVLGYRVPKDAYYLRDPGLEPDELAALHLAASAVRMEGADGVAALWKLGGELAEEGPAPAVASVAVAAIPGADHLAVLFGAISARRPVEFGYHGRARRVDPWRLSFRNGHWYLAGFDHGAGAERSFRLDRVASAVAAAGQPGSFPPPPAPRPPPRRGRWARASRWTPACWWMPTRPGGRSGSWAPTRSRSVGTTDRSCSPSLSPTGPPSGPSSSGSSTTPRSSGRPTCGPRWSTGSTPSPGPDVARLSADDRLQRLLAVVPWVAARDGPRLADVAARFGCREDELIADLELLFLCGLHPYTPDMLIDVDIADGRVWIRYADYFARPLRLTPAEGLGLLAAGRTLLATPGADPNGPLARGLTKLAGALGVGVDEAVEISLGSAPEGVMAVLREAVAASRQVEIEYYAFGRDEWTTRTVDPFAVFSASGQWYVSAWCHLVDDERLFRVDRIRRAALLGTGFAPPADAARARRLPSPAG